MTGGDGVGVVAVVVVGVVVDDDVGDDGGGVEGVVTAAVARGDRGMCRPRVDAATTAGGRVRI